MITTSLTIAITVMVTSLFIVIVSSMVIMTTTSTSESDSLGDIFSRSARSITPPPFSTVTGRGQYPSYSTNDFGIDCPRHKPQTLNPLEFLG